MIEGRGAKPLARKQSDALLVARERVRQELERDEAAQALVAREETSPSRLARGR